MQLNEGLVGIADTRGTSGNEVIQARKVSVYPSDSGCFFLMTSGLRSVRGKALTYFENHLDAKPGVLDRLFQVANAFSQQIRNVTEGGRPSPWWRPG